MSEVADQKELKRNNTTSGGGGCGGCGVFAGIVLLVIVLFVLWSYKNDAEYKAQFNRVRANQLAFTDLQMVPHYGSRYKLTGRVRNNSQYHVSKVRAKFRVLDCNAQSQCDVVGEKEEWNILPLYGLPAGQVRDIDEEISFNSSLQIRGRFQWDYQITEISANKR